LPQENESKSEVTLSRHHYPIHLIETGLAMSPERPTLIAKTDEGDTRIIFAGDGEKALEFANRLIAVRRQMKGI